MRKDISPEEKLLRLIRGEKKKGELTLPTALSSGAVAKLQESVKIKNSGHHLILRRYLSFFNLHKIIPIFFVISCIYLVYSFIYPRFSLKQVELPKLATTEIAELKTEPVQPAKPLESYLKDIKSRQIFSGVAGKEIEGSIGSINADLIKDINLVGIISGENAQAVIEDKKAQKTYYVSEGQFIGEFQVEDIQEAKIILSYKGQRFELYL